MYIWSETVASRGSREIGSCLLKVAVLEIYNKRYPVYDGVNTIGRNKDATINIKHLNISQNHAVLIVNNERHFISDLKSSNGSYQGNLQMVPFKLYELHNDGKVTLGNLTGTYFSQGPFEVEQASQFSIFASQSLYSCHTQVMESSTDADFHDAPTQEFCWAKPISAVKKSPNKARSDPSNSAANTLLLFDNNGLDMSDHFNDENLPILEHNEPFVDSIPENDLGAEEAVEKNLEDDNVSSGNKSDEDHNKEGKLNKMLVTVEDETAVCKDNVCVGKLTNTITIPSSEKELLEHKPITTGFPNVEDDEITDCEDNVDEKCEEKISNLSTLSVSDTETKKLMAPFDDDEATDCEDNVGGESRDGLSKSDKKVIHSDNSNVEPSRRMDDEASDRERNLSNINMGKTSHSAYTDDSSDSMDFLKIDNSCEKTEASNCIENSNSDDKTTKIDTESELIIFKRSKKSSMVLSTQDFDDGSDSRSMSARNILINDSCSERQMLLPEPSFADVSIPQTQYNEFNESDIIPATQDIQNLDIERHQCKHKNSSSNSEEAFKLGLTELMTESSQNDNIIEKGTLSNIEDNVDIYNAPTQRVYFNNTNDINTKCSDSGDLDTHKIDDTFLKPTQKLKEDPIDADNESKELDTDLFNAQTQLITLPGFPAKQTEDTNTFIHSAQKVIKVRQLRKSADTLSDSEDNAEVYDIPTQKISSECNNLPIYKQEVGASSSMVIEKNDAERLAKIPESEDEDVSDIYRVSTQKIMISDSGIATGEKCLEVFSECDAEIEADIFDAPTQVVTRKPRFINENKLSADLSSSDKKTKTFCFKKVPNLNASLTALADNTSATTMTSLEVTHYSSDGTISQMKKQTDDTIDNKDTVDNSSTGVSGTICSDLNRSLAIRESKRTTTRKCGKSIDVQVSVPKSRRSMSISNVDETDSHSFTSKKVEYKRSGKGSSDIGNSSDSRVKTTKKNKALTKLSEQLESNAAIVSDSIISVKSRAVQKRSRAEEKPVNQLNNHKPNSNLINNNTPSDESSSKCVSTSCTSTKISHKKNSPETIDKKPIRTISTRKTISEVVDSRKPTSSRITDTINIPSNIESTTNIRTTAIRKKNVSRKNRHLEENIEAHDDKPIKKLSTCKGISGTIESTSKKDDIDRSAKVEAVSDINKTRKRKNSPTGNNSIDTINTPPKKQKVHSGNGTPQRDLRKQRPKIVFTMMESPQLERQIKQLGGTVVDTVEACTVLITERVKRSQKLLTAIGLRKPICSPKWITESKKAQEFLDPWNYILTDSEAETKWSFSMKKSLERSVERKLLASFTFHIQATNATEVLKGAIESCGGKYVSKIPSIPAENTYIISSPENKNKYNKLLKKHPTLKVIAAEAIFDGVLRQELRFPDYILQ